jgi:hypothetical protein
MAQLIEIKAYFEQQVKAEFENSRISPFANRDWRKGIDLLFELIKFPIDGINLYDGLLNALADVLINKPTDYNALVSFVNYLEKYLTLVGNLTGKTPALDKITLMPLIKALLLKEPPNFDCVHRTHIDKYREEYRFVAHIYRAYCTRNDVAHSRAEDGGLPSWAGNQGMILQNRDSTLVVFLAATLSHYQALKHVLELKQLNEQPELLPYLKGLIEKFSKWESRQIKLYAREEVDLDDDTRQLREGYVEQLWQDFSGQQLMLLGDAGMGKSTTLQCLVLANAKNCLQQPGSQNIPLYLELKLLIDTTLWQEIQAKLPFSNEFTQSLFQQGKINLFLDGLNEVSKFNDRRNAVTHEIQSLITRYPKVRVMIAGREEKIFKTATEHNVPIFSLRKMSDAQINEFLAKNTKSQETRALLQAEIANNPVIASLLRVPLMLYMMIQVVTKTKKIPKHLADLLDNFMFDIYEREKQKDDNFPQDDFHALLCFLGLKMLNASETNAAQPREKMLKWLREKKQADGLSLDLSYILDIATQLGILVRDDKKYSFAHQQYLDYYAEQGMDDFEFDF